MAVESPPWAQTHSNYGAAQTRRAVFFPLSAAGGVKGPGDLLVTANGTPNMSVNVATGEIIIPGSNADQGSYYGLASTITNLVISASNPTNPRIDTIAATVQDIDYSGASDEWVLQVVTGTPTAGATLSNLDGVATLPSNSLLVAYVLVPAAASSITSGDIADERVHSSLTGITTWNVTTQTTTYTALPGDSVLANATSAAFTATLPTPALGARVKVAKTDSSANVVTVRTPSGTILGLGLGAGSTSISLGAEGAFVELHADGTNWHIVGGAQDTGWLNITNFVNSWTNASGYTTQERLIGNLYVLHGQITGGATNTDAFTVSYPPAVERRFASVDAGGVICPINVQTNGAVVPQWTATSTVQVDCISYTFD